jgi:Subtilase family
MLNKTIWSRFWWLVAIGVLVLAGRSSRGADALDWNTNRSRVTADITSRSLLNLLERVAAATHWHILVEPGISHTVSAKFKDLAPGEALHLLLGDVNFALVPGTNSSARLFVFRSAADHATQVVPVAHLPKIRIIPNELVVRLKPGAKIEDVARLLGAKVISRLEGLNAYRLRFEDADAAAAARQQLLDNPEVAAVENNYVIDRPETPQAGPGSSALPELQLKPPAGNGRVVIGLVDTAVQPLGGNLDQFVLKPLSVAGDPQLDPNMPTHGTSMAETMLRTLQMLGNGQSSVQILPVDVYGPNESTSTFDLALGIALAINKGANPINLSLGSPDDSPLVRDLIAQGTQQGITFYTAKGNSPVSTPVYPAADPGATAVTALDGDGQVAPWANRADLSAVGAPGTVMISYNNQTYVVQGTSPATAIVSATASSLMEQDHLSAPAARAQILNAPTTTTIPGK